MVDRAVGLAGPFSAGLTPRELLKRTWKALNENEIVVRASAAAYYALTAFVPFLAVLITIAAKLAPDITAGSGTQGAIGGLTVDEFRAALSRFLPEEAYQVVADEIALIQQRPPVGLLSVGLAASLWFASSLFGTAIDALNRIHGVRETRPFWRLTVTAIGLTVFEVLIVLGILSIAVIWPTITAGLGWTSPSLVWRTAFAWVIVALGILVSFSVFSYFGPNVRRRWKWLTPGSVLGTILFLASGLLLRIFVQYFANYGKAYGSLAGVMLLSFWFWIAAIIMLVAVQVDKVIEAEHEKPS